MNADPQTRSEADDLNAFARWFVDWWRRRGSRMLRADGEQAATLNVEETPQASGVAGSPPQTRDP